MAFGAALCGYGNGPSCPASGVYDVYDASGVYDVYDVYDASGAYGASQMYRMCMMCWGAYDVMSRVWCVGFADGGVYCRRW